VSASDVRDPAYFSAGASGSADSAAFISSVACLRTRGRKGLERSYSGPVPDLKIRRVEYDFSKAMLASVCAENAVCSLDLNRTIYGAA
jgi:hypothetical protein